MEGLISLLLFAGLFFVMMRFGCGSHRKHGNHGSAEHAQNASTQLKVKVVDPVCGMRVETEQGYGKMYKGQLYRFCSRDCLDKFEADPRQYITANLTYERHHEGGAL